MPDRPPRDSHSGTLARLLTLEARTKRAEEQLAELAATVSALAESSPGSSQGEEDTGSYYWADLNGDDRRACRDWVDTVLRRDHPRETRHLHDCWEHHPAACVALVAAWHAWRGAHTAKNRRLDDPARWLRDTLPALRGQLEAEFNPPPETGRRRPCPHHCDPEDTDDDEG